MIVKKTTPEELNKITALINDEVDNMRKHAELEYRDETHELFEVLMSMCADKLINLIKIEYMMIHSVDADIPDDQVESLTF